MRLLNISGYKGRNISGLQLQDLTTFALVFSDIQE
jgi:hypothetical protein